MSLGVMDSVYEALKRHETAPELLEKLVNITSKLNETDPVLSLAAALNDTFKFAPLPNHAPSAPLVFIGPPGVGKTVCVAKLAARARLAGHEAHLISTDWAFKPERPRERISPPTWLSGPRSWCRGPEGSVQGGLVYG